MVEEAKREVKKGVIVKLDFEKAYDRVSWSFLDKVLQHKGFGDRWRRWTQDCLSSSCFSVIVNGQPRDWFGASRDLR